MTGSHRQPNRPPAQFLDLMDITADPASLTFPAPPDGDGAHRPSGS